MKPLFPTIPKGKAPKVGRSVVTTNASCFRRGRSLSKHSGHKTLLPLQEGAAVRLNVGIRDPIAAARLDPTQHKPREKSVSRASWTQPTCSRGNAAWHMTCAKQTWAQTGTAPDTAVLANQGSLSQDWGHKASGGCQANPGSGRFSPA